MIEADNSRRGYVRRSELVTLVGGAVSRQPPIGNVQTAAEVQAFARNIGHGITECRAPCSRASRSWSDSRRYSCSPETGTLFTPDTSNRRTFTAQSGTTCDRA